MPEQVSGFIPERRRSAGQWIRDRLSRHSRDIAEEKATTGWLAKIRADMDRVANPPVRGRHAALPPVPVPAPRPRALPTRLLTPLPVDEDGRERTPPWEPAPDPEDTFAWAAPKSEQPDPEQAPEPPKKKRDASTIVMNVVRPNIESSLEPYLGSLPRFEDDGSGSGS